MAQSFTVTRKMIPTGKYRDKYIEVIKCAVTVNDSDGSFDGSGTPIEINGYIDRVVYVANKNATTGADLVLNQLASDDGFFEANTRDILSSALINIPGVTSQFHGAVGVDSDGVDTGVSVQRVACAGPFELKFTNNSVTDLTFDFWIYVSDEA